MKKKELLKEIMGVPKALTPWVNSLSKIVFDDVDSLSEWDESGPITYKNKDGEEVEDVAYRMDEQKISGKKIMELVSKDNGFDSVKDFVKSEMFNKLPLWRPTVTYRLTGVPSEYYEIENMDGKVNASVNAAVDQELKRFGSHMVLPNVVIHLDMFVDTNNVSKNLEKNLYDTIAHELLHVYQKIKQLEGGKSSDFGKEMMLNALIQNPLVSEISVEWWRKFLNLIYLHLSFEINARVTQLYYLLKEKNINTSEDFLVELKKSHIWKQMKELEDFNAEEYIKKFKLPNVEGNPFQVIDVMMKKMELSSKGVNISSENNALKSFIKLWDQTLELGNKGMKDLGFDITMDNVPKSAKETPLKFFKFFEKRFHKKAEKWKKKLYRIASLLIED
jgi:hypothetical protein